MAGRLEMANGRVRRGMNARLTGGWVAWMITSPGRDRDLGACIGTGIDVYLWMDMTGRYEVRRGYFDAGSFRELGSSIPP